MSSRVYGFRAPDDRWRAMKAARDACTEAGIPVPTEIDEFLGHEEPDEAGVRVDLRDAVRQHLGDMEDGFEVDLSRLPPDLRSIRFVNSW